MYNYKIKIKKVQGFLNESLQRTGIALRIKSSKKLSEKSLFEKADSYLNENYGVRLVEASFNVRTRRKENNDTVNDWGRDKTNRMSGNTKLKRMKDGDHVIRYAKDENGKPVGEPYVTSFNDEVSQFKSGKINSRPGVISTTDLADGEYSPIKKKARGKKYNTTGVACYVESYDMNSLYIPFEGLESRDKDTIEEIEYAIDMDKAYQDKNIFTAPLNGYDIYRGSNLEKSYRLYGMGKITPEEWKNELLKACSEYSNDFWEGMGINHFSFKDCVTNSRIDKDGIVTAAFWTLFWDDDSISFDEAIREIAKNADDDDEGEPLRGYGLTLHVMRIKVMDCKNKQKCENILSNCKTPVKISF